MRGPGHRLVGDTRRTWRCPNCGRERKRLGDVTSMLCDCREEAWMHIVAERILAPRPIQRPSDIERRPADFGIESPPPPPPKPAPTIVKPAVSFDEEIEPEKSVQKPDEIEAQPNKDFPSGEEDLNFDNP